MVNMSLVDQARTEQAAGQSTTARGPCKPSLVLMDIPAFVSFGALGADFGRAAT